MVNLKNLKKVFSRNKQKCSHSYSRKFTLADAIDREGNFMRVYFCTECKDYKWKEAKREKWDEDFLLKLKKDKYLVYSTLEELAVYNQSFRGVFGRGDWPLSKSL